MRYVFLILVSFTCVSSFADELVERATIRNRAADLYLAEDFQELERLASEFRDNRSRTSSGILKLSSLHRGIRSTFESLKRNNDSGWQRVQKKNSEWAREFPVSPMPSVLNASVLMARARSYRGTRRARQIPEKDMQMVSIFAVLAEQVLKEYKEIGKLDPRWYLEMEFVYLFLGAPKDDYWNLIDEAVEAHPGYDDIYFNATNFFSSQWYGSSQDIDALALKALADTKDERGYALYTRVYWAAPPQRDGRFHSMESQINWEYFRKGVDDVLRNYPTQWNINNLAFMVCMSADWEKTQELLSMIEEPIVVSAWQRESNYDYCKIKVGRWAKKN